MISNKFVLGLMSIALGFIMTGILSAVLLPAAEVIGNNLTEGTYDLVATVLLIFLLGTMIGFPVVIFRWLQKRAGASANELPENERNPKLAFFGLGTICLGILIYGSTASTNSVSDLAYLTGQNLVLGILWYVGYSMAFGKHLSGTQKGFSYVAILTSLILGGSIAADRQSQQGAEMLARLGENFDSIRMGAESADGRMEEIETDSSAIESEDEFIASEAFVNNFMNEMVSLNNNYITELEAISFYELIDGERIRTDSNLSESSFILSRATAIVEKYEQRAEELFRGQRDIIETLNISAAAKREMRAGFERSFQNGLNNVREIYSIEKEIVSVSEDIVIFLDASKSSWSYEEDQFVFSTNKNLEIFNSLHEKINEMVARQGEISESSAQNVDRILQQAENN
jgi:hypothetical protein